jgi:hypothetical protein
MATLNHNGQVLNVSIETITPDMAHAYLSRPNGKQTKGRSGVNRYADDMKNDRWRLTGEPLIFNSKDDLDNGYSRLGACILAGVPFTTLVVRGTDARSFDVLDTGKSRSLADLLRFRGKEYVNIVAYVAKRLAIRDKGLAVSSSANVTRQEEMLAVRRYPVIEDYARKAQALGPCLPHALLAFVWYLFGEQYPIETAAFFRAFAPLDGDRVDSKHPAQRLRTKLTGADKFSKAERTKFAFAALNAAMGGERPKKLEIDGTTNVLAIGDSGKYLTIS